MLFRIGRGCIDLDFDVRQVSEKNLAYKTDGIFGIFMHLENSYDTIEHVL